MRSLDHATAARNIAVLLAEVDRSGEPVKIVDPGRHEGVLISLRTWQALSFALELQNETENDD